MKKKGGPINIGINRIPFDPIKKTVTVYLSLFCSDVTPAATNLYKYSNAVSSLVLKVFPNSNPNIVGSNLKKFKCLILVQFWLILIQFLDFSAPTNDQLLDPSFDPCTCDLTVDYCDQNCCCDSDCTSDDLNALNLVCPQKYRSIFEKTIDKWTCKDKYNNPKFAEPDYFPILCIQVNFRFSSLNN